MAQNRPNNLISKTVGIETYDFTIFMLRSGSQYSGLNPVYLYYWPWEIMKTISADDYWDVYI